MLGPGFADRPEKLRTGPDRQDHRRGNETARQALPRTEYPIIRSQPIADLYVALALVALAFAVRLPALVLPSMDWDEGLYLMIAADLNAGHLPYAGLWDRKPIGIFVLFALVERVFQDGVLGVRVLASLFAALGAFSLYRIWVLMFQPGATIGMAAATAYVLFSGENSGLASNTEVFFVPLAIVGFHLGLRSALRSGGPARPGAGLPELAAGLVLGVAFQIKYVVAFDLAALAVALVILAGEDDRPRLERLRQSGLRVGALALGFAAPTVAVLALYAGTGELEAFLEANVAANLGYLSQPFGSPTVPLFAAINYGPLCVGAGLALLFARRLISSRREWRAVIVCVVWIAAVLIGLAMLRRWYEHYFIQLLPSLSLLTGLVAARAILDLARTRYELGCAIGLLLAAGFFAANKDAFVATGDLVLQRHARGDRAAGDIPRIVARDLAAELRSGDTVFVFDQDPAIYYLAEAAAPTRYPFPGHWIDGAGGMFDPLAQLEQVLEREPRFIVTRLDTFAPPERDAAAPAGEADQTERYQRLKKRLHAALSETYDLADSYDPAEVWGGRAVGIKPWGANVYRRRIQQK
jgi:Dolichyl-phosphate-mannose-protein mannosyltransferase